jgi:hypothetical protein
MKHPFTGAGQKEGIAGLLLAKSWLVSPVPLFLFSSIVFLWLFPTVVLGVERNLRYDLLLAAYLSVQFLGFVAGQGWTPPRASGHQTGISAGDSFFKACWLFWGISFAYKVAMLLLGGIAKYQLEESEALFRLPYVMNVLDSLAFRVAPFLAWVASRGKISAALGFVVLLDLALGIATLTKEYAAYVLVAAVFGLAYWRILPSFKVIMIGAAGLLAVFLLGPALVWTRMETLHYTEPLEIVSGLVENVDRTLLDEIQRDTTILAVKERFDMYSAGLLAMESGEFREMAARCRNALPFFWVPRSYEKEITFRSGNYLGASVGLVPEGDVSGIAFPNPIVLDAMFGFWVGLAVFGGMSWLFGAAFRKIRRTRSVEWWMGYLILYLGLMVQVFIGLPAPALPYKMVYEAFTWGACILMLRGCRSMMGWLAGRA